MGEELNALLFEEHREIVEYAFYGMGDTQGVGAILANDHEYDRGFAGNFGRSD